MVVDDSVSSSKMRLAVGQSQRRHLPFATL
jgi:hypothetical protein